MQVIITIAQMLVRITGVLLLLLGLLIWADNAANLIMIHTLLGVIMVISMWVLAVASTQAGIPIGLASGVALAGLVVLVLGMTQTSLLPGELHFVIRIVHLLVGVFAVGSAEIIAGRLKRLSTPALNT